MGTLARLAVLSLLLEYGEENGPQDGQEWPSSVGVCPRRDGFAGDVMEDGHSCPSCGSVFALGVRRRKRTARRPGVAILRGRVSSQRWVRGRRDGGWALLPVLRFCLCSWSTAKKTDRKTARSGHPPWACVLAEMGSRAT